LIAIFYFLYYRYIYLNFIELTDNYVSDKLEFAAQTIEVNINSKLNEIKTISDVNFKYKNSNLDYNKILPVLEESLVCENVFIGDIDGKCVSDDYSLDMSEYDYYKEACNGSVGISGFLYDDNNKKWVTSIASPLRDEKGEIQKIIVVFYDIDSLKELIGSIDFGAESAVFITDINNIAGNSDVSKSIGKNGIISKADNESGVIEAIQNDAFEILSGEKQFVYNDRNMRTFFRTFKDNDWILAAAIPENVLYEDIYFFNAVTTIIVVFVILAAVIFFVYSSRINSYIKNEKKKSDFVISSSNIITFKMNFNGGIIDCNKNFIKIIGFKENEIKEMSIYSVIPDEYYSKFDSYFESVINLLSHGEQLDMPLVSNVGGKTYILWNADVNNELNQIEFVGTNISNLKDYEKKIQKLAYFDQLTGLNNLAYLEEYFNNFTTTNNFAAGSAFIYIDVDNFKYINDMFGHNIGDRFIVDLSNRILSLGNLKAKVCKRSGDEFVIFYENPENKEEIKTYVKRVFNVIKNEYQINNIKLNISISMGISMYPDDGLTYNELFKCSDIALQTAKEEGKNRFKYFNNSMKNELYELINIENDLKSAVENNEFVLYYQPQYVINTGELYGFEALIRWHSPSRGFVQPNKFIPQAEKNQLIIPIGKFAFEKTCDFINELIEKGYDDLCISVNVSVVQMMCDDFVDFIIGTLEKKQINPKNIKLEITESVLIKSIDETLNKINTLNKYGIRFALDDFGTGYSSLYYLKQMPLDVLKIDKSFTDSILDKNTNKEILSLIISLAQNINLHIIAEGIEELEQLEWLNNKGCDIGQGFYMGKPMPKEKAFEILGKTMYDLR